MAASTRTVAGVHRRLQNFLVRALNGTGPPSLTFHFSLLSPPATGAHGDCGFAVQNTRFASLLQPHQNPLNFCGPNSRGKGRLLSDTYVQGRWPLGPQAVRKQLPRIRDLLESARLSVSGGVVNPGANLHAPASAAQTIP